MKIIRLQSISFILAAILIVFVSSYIQYNVLSKRVDNQLDGDLLSEKLGVTMIINNADIKGVIPQLNHKTFLKKSGFKEQLKDQFSTINEFDTLKNRVAEYRELKSYILRKGSVFELTIREPSAPTQILLQSIIEHSVIVFVLMAIFLIIINRFLSIRFWSSFKLILSELKKVDITKNSTIKFPKTGVEEFETLSCELEVLINKQFELLIGQKRFVENAAHELQTPVAVLKSKLELLIQSENVKEKECKLISELLDTTNQMTNLNQTLLLISKIENNQFPAVTTVNLSTLCRDVSKMFEHQIEARNISLSIEVEKEVYAFINPDLARILLTNLIKNALVHNIKNGKIMIKVGKRNFQISNTGSMLSLDETRIFERFHKQPGAQNSTGLGLALVKQICEISQLSIKYKWRQDMHHFTTTLKV